MDTAGAMLGRQEATRVDRSTEVQSTLDRARSLFAGLSKALEAEIRRLETDGASEDAWKPGNTNDLMRTVQKTLCSVLEMETKMMRESGPGSGGVALDLEDARAEIARRLARLAP